MTIWLILFSVLLGQQSEQISGVSVSRISQPKKELRFEVTIPASLDEVWRAFSTSNGLKTWLWSDARVDLRRGGDWLVLYPGGKTGGGVILSFSPKKRIAIRALAPETFPAVRKEGTPNFWRNSVFASRRVRSIGPRCIKHADCKVWDERNGPDSNEALGCCAQAAARPIRTH